mgnify:CR=1 FL=1
MATPLQPIIIVRKKKKGGHGHHGGAWKVAYADFVTAMMAFFMVMWLVATMPQEQLGGIADYFKNPSAVEGKSSSMAPGRAGPGGAGEAPIKMFDHARKPPDASPIRKPGAMEQQVGAAQKAGDEADRDESFRVQRDIIESSRGEQKASEATKEMKSFQEDLKLHDPSFLQPARPMSAIGG